MIVVAVYEEFAQRRFKPGARLANGRISDDDGNWHDMPLLVIREATRQEYLDGVKEVCGKIVDWSRIDSPETKFYLVSVD